MHILPFSELPIPSTVLPGRPGGSQTHLSACSSPAAECVWELDSTGSGRLRLVGKPSSQDGDACKSSDWSVLAARVFSPPCSRIYVSTADAPDCHGMAKAFTSHRDVDATVSILEPVVDFHIYVQERGERVPQNPDPEEGIVLDLGIFRLGLIRALGRDSVIDAEDVAVIRAFDEPFNDLSRRTKAIKAFNSSLRNGWTRRSEQSAKDASIAFVFDQELRLDNVVDFSAEPLTPEAA